MKTTKQTIGFKSGLYDTRVTVRKENSKSSPADDYIPVDFKDNPFSYAMMKAINDFIVEELKGYANSCATLEKKIHAANLLFREEKKQLSKAYRCSMAVA